MFDISLYKPAICILIHNYNAVYLWQIVINLQYAVYPGNFNK